MDLHYDDIYHLALIVKTTSREFTLERNQTVSTGAVRSFEDTRDVAITAGLTFGKFVEDGEKVSKQPFWQYNPVTSNCQIFVTDLLKGSSLLTSDLRTFINQDAVGLLKNASATRRIAETISNIGHRLDVLLTGAGEIKE